uniref:Uncharacterized protein n=1 Tax=Urocitellus parryii TaxID=9999 RepID=A0A8D2GMP7_UROPR
MSIWSSPLQPAPLVNLVTYPQLQLVATVDQQGLIKVWKAETGWEWASFCLPTSCSAVEACDHPEGSFLLVACAEGTLYTLTVPQLQVVSKVTLFPSPFVSLLCSPDRQWLFASAHNSDLVFPQVFYTQSLLHPSEDELPVSTTLTVRLSSKACWAPDEAARLIVIESQSVFLFEKAQQMASFLLPDAMMPPHLMQSHGSQVILLTSGSELVLLTIHGLQLEAFQDHQKPITALWVVSAACPAPAMLSCRSPHRGLT